MPHYQNRWIPSRALEILASESGTILDLGGGASPYFKATHVADILPFEVAWRRPFWGGERENKILPRDYTQADICAGKPLPFDKDHFDLGLCSHTLEDLRDPINALAELGRVCKRILVITPSRLLEQTRNIAHPRYCGFSHHPWAVFMGEGFIGFRILNCPAATSSAPTARRSALTTARSCITARLSKAKRLCTSTAIRTWQTIASMQTATAIRSL
jgi:SAM-dependent methyltransferase